MSILFFSHTFTSKVLGLAYNVAAAMSHYQTFTFSQTTNKIFKINS